MVVVQGECGRAGRNREAGVLEIRPRDARIALPTGSDVEIAFGMSTSNPAAVVAAVVAAQEQSEIAKDCRRDRPRAGTAGCRRLGRR
ncbi:hypothetical protein [Protofrankia coriariae]|uniref:Uncharacterized protein n=1 Tax=Protofrankia coriariae TaxID=1562887 RepID=A0ABR5F3P8_9ACTN|nr:hypothetical protein [Protofrankia coriariae]KLL11350.1 hypothetical protein FrCorBMG51_12160 [Protofrankia coriariae]